MKLWPAAALVAISFTATAAQETTPLTSREPMTLEAAFNRALTANPRVRRAHLEVSASEAQQRSILAAILPRVSVSGNLTLNSEQVEFGSEGDARVLLPSEDWSYRLNISQPVFAGLREKRAYDQAKLVVKNAVEGVDAAEEQILLQVAADYLGVVAGDELVSVETKNVELAQRRLQQAHDLFEAGEVTRVEVLRGETAVKAAQRRLSGAVQARETAAGRLRIDLNTDDPIRVVPPQLSHRVPSDEQRLLETAEARRPELAQARNIVAINRLEVAKQRGAYLPVITADAAWINQKSTFPTDQYSTASLRFSIPIYQGGEIGARIAAARDRQAQAELALEETRQAVREEVRKALLDVRAAETSLALAVEQEDSAEAEYEQIFEAYRAQEATSLDVQAAESNLADARRAVVTSRLDLDLARLRVAFASGTLEEAVTTEELQ